MQLQDENLQISGKSQIFQSFLLSLKRILHNDNAMNLKTSYNTNLKYKHFCFGAAGPFSGVSVRKFCNT